MTSLRLYFTLLRASLAGQLTYRRSFVMEMFGLALITGAELAAITFIFDRVESIQGWQRWEVLCIFGIVELAFCIAQTLAPGLESMAAFVRKGEFDRVLLRPMPTLLHMFGQRIALNRLGRGIVGLAVLLVALHHLQLGWSATQIAMLVISVLSSALVYVGLFTINAAFCFVSVEGDEAFNAFTYGGAQMSQMPLSIYPGWVRGLFMYLIPVGFVVYFPSVALMDRPDPLGMPEWFCWLSVPVSLVWMLLAALLWQAGVRRYQSTGS